METVNIHCPECRQLIAVARDDIGHYVRCPLCQKVILTSLPADEPPAFAGPGKHTDEESIFAPPGAGGDDLFGSEPSPRVELPPGSEPPGGYDEPRTEPMPPTPYPAGGYQEPGGLWDDPAAGPAAPAGPAMSSATMQAARRAAEPGILVPLLLIFLIPYAIVTTVFILYMVFNQRAFNHDPLERMLYDNRGAKDAPVERIVHDLPVPEKLRTGLDEPLEVGAVRVLPRQVLHTPEGDLALQLELTNVSDGLKLNPIPENLLRYYRAAGLSAARPYTFLQADGQGYGTRVYGGDVEWWVGSGQNVRRVSSVKLSPGESMTAVLVTDMRDRKLVRKLLDESRPMLWRVHLVRGLEELAGADRVITCVVGVEFGPGQVARGELPFAGSRNALGS